MKRIYLLMAAVVGLTSASQAQRSIDLKFVSTYPTNGIVLVSADEDPDMQDKAWATNDINFEFTNLGPDDLLATDTIVLGAPLVFSNYISVYNSAGMPANSAPASVPVDDAGFTYNDANVTESGEEPLEFCDTAWVVDQALNVISDPDITNNRSCISTKFNIWFLDVANVNKVNGFSMYPNPAATKLNVVSTFNNAKNANIIIRDVVGKTVFTQNLGTNLNGQQTFALDISNFVTGMYVIELNIDGNRITRQIQVQK